MKNKPTKEKIQWNYDPKLGEFLSRRGVEDLIEEAYHEGLNAQIAIPHLEREKIRADERERITKYLMDYPQATVADYYADNILQTLTPKQ